MGAKLGKDDVRNRLDVDHAVGSGNGCKSRARLLDRKFKCLSPRDAADRRVGRGRLSFVFRPPIHAEIDHTDALLHARLIALDGVVSVSIEQDLQHQLLAGDHDAFGRTRHAAFRVDLHGRGSFDMFFDQMIEHQAPDGAGVPGDFSFSHIKSVAKAGLIGIC